MEPLPLQGCAIAYSVPEHRDMYMHFLIEYLGATIKSEVDDDTTHLLVTDSLGEPALAAKHFCPWVQVVHMHWLLRCYVLCQKVKEDQYEADFYVSAKRTGTSTYLGTKEEFYFELGQFHAVECYLPNFVDQPLRHILSGRVQGDPRQHPIWKRASQKLQHTTFWGHYFKDRAWEARKHVVLSLQRAELSRKPRKRPRRCQDGPAHELLALAQLPAELMQYIVLFL